MFHKSRRVGVSGVPSAVIRPHEMLGGTESLWAPMWKILPRYCLYRLCVMIITISAQASNFQKTKNHLEGSIMAMRRSIPRLSIRALPNPRPASGISCKYRQADCSIDAGKDTLLRKFFYTQAIALLFLKKWNTNGYCPSSWSRSEKHVQAICMWHGEFLLLKKRSQTELQ